MQEENMTNLAEAPRRPERVDTPYQDARKLAIRIAAGGFLGLVTAACAPQQQESQPFPAPITRAAEQQQPPIPSDPGIKVELPVVGKKAVQTPTAETPAAVPTATPEPPKPTATATKAPEPTATAKPEPTKEVEKEVPCQILPTEFCSTGDLIDWKNPIGEQVKFIGFNLPPGTPILSPIDGAFQKRKLPQPFSGSNISVSDLVNDPKLTRFSFSGDIDSANVPINVKRGDIIGQVGNNDAKNLGYNVLIGVTQRDPATGKFSSAEDILKKYFPNAAKDAKSLSYEGPPITPKITVGPPVYVDKPPR